MTDIILTAGRALARDLSSSVIVGRSSQEPAPSGAAPRQEWLGAKTTAQDSAGDGHESTPIRLVGHKVLAQGAGRAPRRQVADEAESGDLQNNPALTQVPTPRAGSLDIYTASADSASYATRAIAIFSQQVGGYTAAKGTRIDTYA
jgi:hypothetical protein